MCVCQDGDRPGLPEGETSHSRPESTQGRDKKHHEHYYFSLSEQFKERDMLEGIFKFWRLQDTRTFDISKHWYVEVTVISYGVCSTCAFIQHLLHNVVVSVIVNLLAVFSEQGG